MTTPQINRTTMSSSRHFVFSGTNGQPGATYYVLASPNLQLPANQWAVVATNTFNQAGGFTFSNSVASGMSPVFYQLSLRLPAADVVLPRTIALFKTPTLRDLGQSAPYMHTGRFNTVENVLQFYQKLSGLARSGLVRNADPELGDISLRDSAIAPLAAFLRSLDEDYTD
jgi:hypothetical protein